MTTFAPLGIGSGLAGAAGYRITLHSSDGAIPSDGTNPGDARGLLYLRDAADADNPHGAPLRAASLRGLPPATIVIAGYDPLGDEGDVTLRQYLGMLHGFFVIGAFDRTAEGDWRLCCHIARLICSTRQRFRPARSSIERNGYLQRHSPT